MNEFEKLKMGTDYNFYCNLSTSFIINTKIIMLTKINLLNMTYKQIKI